MTRRTVLGYGPDKNLSIGIVQPALLSLVQDGMGLGIALDHPRVPSRVSAEGRDGDL